MTSNCIFHLWNLAANQSRFKTVMAKSRRDTREIRHSQAWNMRNTPLHARLPFLLTMMQAWNMRNTPLHASVKYEKYATACKREIWGICHCTQAWNMKNTPLHASVKYEKYATACKREIWGIWGIRTQFPDVVTDNMMT